MVSVSHPYDTGLIEILDSYIVICRILGLKNPCLNLLSVELMNSRSLMNSDDEIKATKYKQNIYQNQTTRTTESHDVCESVNGFIFLQDDCRDDVFNC